MFEGIRSWHCRLKTLKAIRYKHCLLQKMICVFSDRVAIRIKLDEHADGTLSTFNQMLDDVRGVIVKHNSALNNVSVNMENSRACQGNIE